MRSKEITFEVGVYPKNNNSHAFINHITKEFLTEIEGYCANFSFNKYLRSDAINFWIVRKNFPFNPLKSSDLDDVFTTVREEMKPLEDIIDRAIIMYK